MSSTDVQRPSGRFQTFRNCLSCRLLSGGGLVAAGGYVYLTTRDTIRMGGPTRMGTVTKIMFALCLASWGATIMVDPVGKMTPKEK